ncbi:MAG: hypothetical protein PHH54_00375 [Candidatus Nanoarchaeia archaeon]|nr:hypothetical protein [Candidatus Nanoarchaeia archaeon]MDD5740418.1 hypothetical protein [Candidatus Nanoarchaeia archaeon]
MPYYNVSDDKEGECEVCKTTYIKEVWDSFGSNPNDWGYQFENCPTCLYNPQLKRDISELIGIGVRADIVDGKIKYNCRELSEMVKDEVIRHIQNLENKNERRWHELLYHSSLQLPEMLNKNTRGTFSSFGNLEFNTQELSDLVNQKIIELWGRYGASEEKWLKQEVKSGYIK